jgi:hypothetical protein
MPQSGVQNDYPDAPWVRLVPNEGVPGSGSLAAGERTNREAPLMDSGERASVSTSGWPDQQEAATHSRAVEQVPLSVTDRPRCPAPPAGPLVTRIPVFPDVWEYEPAEADAGRGDLACPHGTGRCLRRDCRRGDAGRRWRNGLVGDAVGTADAAPPGVDDCGRDGRGSPAGWARGDQPPDHAGPRAVAAGCGGQATG